jgi:hypothetical protein
VKKHLLDTDGRPLCDKGDPDRNTGDPYAKPVKEWAAPTLALVECERCHDTYFRRFDSMRLAHAVDIFHGPYSSDEVTR